MIGADVKIRLANGTGTADLKYLHEDRDRHGNVRLYYHHKGPKVRIRAEPGSDEFWEEVDWARSGKAPAVKSLRDAKEGSLSWLIQRYYSSAEFKGLSTRTRYVRRRNLDLICMEYPYPGDPIRIGALPFASILASAIRALRDRKAETPEAANGLVKALRQVFTWAVAAEHLQRNPAKDVPYIKTGSDGFHTWEVAEVEQFEARHGPGTKARKALAILLYTGARRSDAVRLGKQMVRNGKLRFQVTKRGKNQKPKWIEIPILPVLQAELDRGPQDNLTWLVTEFGKPFTSNGFGNWFRKRCDEAGLKHCSAHGLRKAGATIAANNGATPHQLMAIYGWASIKEAQRYTEQADRRRLADEAMHFLVAESSHSDSGEKIEVLFPSKNKG